MIKGNEVSTEFYLPPEPKFVPIPREFHSLENDGPFEKCLQCDLELRKSDQPYMIERVFVLDEPIIEYAMCETCALAAHSELSSDSRESISDYMLTHIDLHSRMKRLANWTARETDDTSAIMDRCLLSGTLAEDSREKQISAWCRGDQMRVDHVFPLMISGVAIEAINGVLSEQTRGWIDDFVGDSFGMPPEFCDNPDFRPILI